ncbi:type II toxin-antitoxin system HigB family toxin [Chamaesiphon sp.]|uniref:type II toxin-antitoxin system HigB family toxin n=1 Tax=Chamaesiphon sp. TaxID=2814140 RepID=UPI00359304E5
MVASTYKILLKQTADGQSSATVLELPDCHVIAITPQAAISQVQARLIVSINYLKQIIYFKYFLTHAEYDKDNWKNDPYF